MVGPTLYREGTTDGRRDLVAAGPLPLRFLPSSLRAPIPSTAVASPPFGPFQVLTFHSSVRPSGGLSLLVPPFRPCLPPSSFPVVPAPVPLPTHSQIKGNGRRGKKAQWNRRRDVQASFGRSARASKDGKAETRREGRRPTCRSRRRRTTCDPGGERLLLSLVVLHGRSSVLLLLRPPVRETIITLYKKCVRERGKAFASIIRSYSLLEMRKVVLVEDASRSNATMLNKLLKSLSIDWSTR